MVVAAYRTVNDTDDEENAEESVFLQVYRANTIVAATLGIWLNAALLYIICRNAVKKHREVARLLAVIAVNDLTLSLFEMVSQHVIHESHGVMYVFSFGVDVRCRSKYVRWAFSFVRFATCTQTVTTQLVNHYYRYQTMSQPVAVSPTMLWKAVCVSVCMSLFIATMYTSAVVAGDKHDPQRMVKNLSAMWQNADGTSNVIGVVLWADLETKLYILSITVFANLVFLGCGYYCWKSYHAVNGVQEYGRVAYSKIRAQFNRCIIAQTVCLALIGVTPITVLQVALVCNVEGFYYGPATIMPFVWFPALNALITLCGIDAYRLQVGRALRCAPASASAAVHASRSTVRKSPTKGSF